VSLTLADMSVRHRQIRSRVVGPEIRTNIDNRGRKCGTGLLSTNPYILIGSRRYTAVRPMSADCDEKVRL
jgi:hypothetical protein